MGPGLLVPRSGPQYGLWLKDERSVDCYPSGDERPDCDAHMGVSPWVCCASRFRKSTTWPTKRADNHGLEKGPGSVVLLIKFLEPGQSFHKDENGCGSCQHPSYNFLTTHPPLPRNKVPFDIPIFLTLHSSAWREKRGWMVTHSSSCRQQIGCAHCLILTAIRPSAR